MKNQHIGKLYPADGFRIQMQSSLPGVYSTALTHLYQPLLGMAAVALYHTLLNEQQMQSRNEPVTHHTLMTLLDSSLDVIYEARLKLEAVGLMRTYREESDQHTIFTYELYPPFTPQAFFADDVLSQLLYHQLGETKFQRLQHALIPVQMETEAEEVTAAFEEIFAAQTGSGAMPPREAENLSEKDTAFGPVIDQDIVDVDWLSQSLKQRMINPSSILTSRNKKLMESMVVLYGLTSPELDKALLWAVNDQHQLNTAEFKTACHDLFLSRPQTSNVKLVDWKQKEEKAQEKEAETRQEKLVRMLETISPKQLLEDLSGNGTAAAADLKIIRDVMAEQALSPGIMNVLVHYVLLKTDMKLSKPYMEKIAAHWMRKKITTVTEAIDLARSENQKYQEWSKNKQQPIRRRQAADNEVIPDWFKNNKSADHSIGRSESASDQPSAAELLKQYNESKRQM